MMASLLFPHVLLWNVSVGALDLWWSCILVCGFPTTRRLWGGEGGGRYGLLWFVPLLAAFVTIDISRRAERQFCRAIAHFCRSYKIVLHISLEELASEFTKCKIFRGNPLNWTCRGEILHRIINLVGRVLKDHIVPPCHGQGLLLPNQVAQSSIHAGNEHFQG